MGYQELIFVDRVEQQSVWQILTEACKPHPENFSICQYLSTEKKKTLGDV